MKITIELTEEECAVYRKWNFLRMTSRASSMLEESVDYKDQDTMDLAKRLRRIGEVTEVVREQVAAAVLDEQRMMRNAKS
jgi:hypothetical protein